MSDTTVSEGLSRGQTSGTDDLLSAFEGTVVPVRAGPLYVLGLFVVAAAMVVLPLIYIGIICCVAYGVYYHATENVSLLQGSGTRGRLLVFITPLVVGGILILFMIKPLFARQVNREKRHSLDRSTEPLLFAFVERLCRAIGAPAPRRIDVDCEVNASASFRRRWLSMFGRDLVLTLGLPLVAGLNLRELTGVLAHEFGHFTQGAAMRLTYIIRSVNFWFARVVYERDSWDERLIRWSEQGESRMRIVLYLSRLFVWLTRKILWALMMAGHAISCWMMRQMEYDADRHQVQVVGTAAFESTMSRVQMLDVAAQGAYAGLRHLWNEQTLVDNLPVLIAAEVGRIPGEAREAIERAIRQSKTGSLDTHPADQSRIESARRQNASGIFRVERPATVLFRDFEGACKAATRLVYEEKVGPQANGAKLISAAELIGVQDEVQQQRATLRRYFGPTPSITRPLALQVDDLAAPVDSEKTVGELRQARRQMEQELPQAVELHETYQKAESLGLDALQAKVLLEVGLKIDAKDFQLPQATPEAATASSDQSNEIRKAIDSKLEPLKSAVRTRLSSALRLLSSPAFAGKIEDAERLRASTGPVLAALGASNETHDKLRELQSQHAVLRTLLVNVRSNQENKKLMARVRETLSSICRCLEALKAQLAGVPYPFEHAQAGISIGQHVIEAVPSPDDIQQTYGTIEEAFERLDTLYFRSLARLASVAERVEESIGLEPIPMPADEPDETHDSTTDAA
jgi:Zn-dependent protease with chaperone function